MLQQSNVFKNYVILEVTYRQILNGGSLHDDSPTIQPKFTELRSPPTLTGSCWSSFIVTTGQGGFNGIAVHAGHLPPASRVQDHLPTLRVLFLSVPQRFNSAAEKATTMI